MSMEPKNANTQILFESQCVYLIPKYQRLYVWNQDNQWEPLWLDVIEMAKKVFDNDSDSSSIVGIDRELEPHFLGAVVLKIGGSTPELSQKWRVIDGQQRITTIQLLLAATYSTLKKFELVNQANRIKLLISNANSDKNWLKVKHHDSSYEQFADVMFVAINGPSDEILSSTMFDCFEFFRKKVESWLEERKSNLDQAADVLIKTLITKLQVVAIYLGFQDKEYLIFETLNARGEPLTEWDKIKNYLLYRVENDSNLNQDQVYENYLMRFDDSWWRESEGRGAQQRPRTDIFIDYWLESRKISSVSVKRVFRDFQNYIDQPNEPLSSNLELLFTDANYYKQFSSINYSNSNFETSFHNNRIRLSIGAIWPLLLYLQRLDAPDDLRQTWFKHLERYFIRRKICGRQARSYDQLGLEILEDLESQNYPIENVSNVILDKLLRYSRPSMSWPSDHEVESAVLHNWHPRYVNLIVLRAIENYLTPPEAGIPILAEKIHVEHLLPIKWEENWPLQKNTAEEKENRNWIVNVLGNLTLLNAPLNVQVSNNVWEVKRDGIAKSDNLFLNRHLIRKYSESWNKKNILERGKWMVKQIENIWPGRGD